MGVIRLKSQTRISILNEIRIHSWRLLFFQNILIILVTLLYIPQFILFHLFWQLGHILGGIINLFFTFAILLDLIAILAYCISSGGFIYYSRVKIPLKALTLVSGLFWVGLSFFWRIPLFIKGPYNIGFSIRRSIATPDISHMIFNDPLLMFILLFSSLLFLIFLYSNDKLLFSSESEFHTAVDDINIGTLYGLSNLFGFLLIAITFFDDSSWLIQLGVFIKLVVTPVLGMRTSKKTMASLIYKDKTESTPFSKHITNWLKNIWRISSEVQVIPTKRGFFIIGCILLIIFLFPLSPFFIQYLAPQPTIYGPFIYRDYENDEALLALQYVESLSIAEITGCSEEFFMDNETLLFFLDLLSRGVSIEGSSFKPYSYSFIWNVTIMEPQFPVLNYSTVHFNWFDTEPMGYLDLTCFIWWENSTRYLIQEPSSYTDLNRTAFNAYSSPVKWVFYGWFNYSEIFGSLGAHGISAKQLIYLSQDNSIICFAYAFEHGVA